MESWTEKCNRLDAEREAQEKARRNEPRMVKVSRSFKFDSMFGWLYKLRSKMRKPNNPKLPITLFCALCMCGCAGFHATTGADGGSSLTALNLGGKQMMAGVKSPALQMDQYYSDTEAAFKTFATAAAIAYGINQIAGAYEAVTNAKTAADATKSIELGKQATSVQNTKTTADVIKSVGVAGEVPIAPVSLP